MGGGDDMSVDLRVTSQLHKMPRLLGQVFSVTLKLQTLTLGVAQ